MKYVLPLFALSLLTACGSSIRSGKAMTKKLLDVISNTDVERAPSVFLPDSLADSLFECKTESTKIKAWVEKERQLLISEINRVPFGLQIEFISTEEKIIKSYKSGDSFKGCSVLKGFTLIKLKQEFRIKHNEKSEERSKDAAAIKFKGNYYLIGS